MAEKWGQEKVVGDHESQKEAKEGSWGQKLLLPLPVSLASGLSQVEKLGLKAFLGGQGWGSREEQCGFVTS